MIPHALPLHKVGTLVISNTQNLPKAYFQPQTRLPVGKEQIDNGEQVRTGQSPRIIDAEWQQIATPPAYRTATRPYAPPLFVDLDKSPGDGASRARAAARYRQMEPVPGPAPGTLLNISA